MKSLAFAFAAAVTMAFAVPAAASGAPAHGVTLEQTGSLSTEFSSSHRSYHSHYRAPHRAPRYYRHRAAPKRYCTNVWRYGKRVTVCRYR